MKRQIDIPKLTEYCNNRLSPKEMREVKRWIQAHPEGDSLIRGLKHLLEQESRSGPDMAAFLERKRADLSRKLFGKHKFD